MSTEKLTILFLAANPEKTDRVKLDEEAHAIDAVLQSAAYRIFDLRTHWALRYGDLPELLLRYNPHIVHFSGHGSTLGDLALQDDSGKMHLVQPDALAALFEVLRDNIRCVVLNACYSQLQAEGIAKAIDFVVGMNREFKDAAAIDFAAGFYQGLGYGRTIKTAFDLGCVRIGLGGKGIVQTATRPPVVMGEPTGTPVLGGTAAIPQLIALRRDPDSVKLQVETPHGGARAAQTSAPGSVVAGAGGVAVGGNVYGGITIHTAGQASESPATLAARERDHYRSLLANFLIPLDGYLAYTYRVFDELRRDTGIEHLELDPEGLKRVYSMVLPKNDPRRVTWMKTIERLQAENRKIVKLIEDNYGNIVLPAFRDACNEFKAHANAWEDFWVALKDMGIDTPREVYEDLVSTPFPRSFPDALRAEYDEVQRRASGGE